MSMRVYAWCEDESRLVFALSQLRGRGYERLEAYTPYPMPQVPDALALPRSRLPLLAFWVGMSAAAATYAVQWLLNDWLYPINVGARPPHFPLSYVPICFEVGILFAALTAFLGVLIRGKLGRLYTRVFDLPDYARVTRDGMLIELTVSDSAEAEVARDALHALGLSELSALSEAPCD